jgi:hypothetical protein
MIKHLQREAHLIRSAVEVQHGSSPQAISPAALHPSEASPKSDRKFKHLQCDTHQTIFAADVQHGLSHTKTLKPYRH